jgi:hypothetical protein
MKLLNLIKKEWDEHSIIKKLGDKLMKRHNAHGIIVTNKVVNGKITKKKVVQFFVLKKKPEAELLAKELVPKKIKGIETDIVEREIPKALNVNTSRIRPIQPGYSIGHYLITAGTFGCIVYKNRDYYISNGEKRYLDGPVAQSFKRILPWFGFIVNSEQQPMILSNNHVLANVNKGKIGDCIIQPGKYDGGRDPQDKVAELYDFIKLVGGVSVDCALAKPINNYFTDFIIAIGVPKGIATVKVGQEVQKSGRTTGYKKGKVTGFGSIQIDYGEEGLILLKDQILTTCISAGGDSGSLVLDMDGNAIGLLFAGSTQDTIINPIKNVCDELGVTITK